ncbi:hypothetical protein [Halorhabdus amylolytica]|uniref:hypothetical protein n=1 Tax=Halorhabdus amylolytica TaxID=2559573 RepID=UPI0010A9FAD6|nr:hypothetical protein [Halorhabdus amylolytica]
MEDDKSDEYQLRFEDGNVVAQSDTSATPDADHTAESIEPGVETGFVVEVKPGALEVNDRLREAVGGHGDTLEFGSREHAEDYASQLSASNGPLRVQAAPENEPTDIDAYLLAEHNPSIKEPADIDGDTWTFDVGANLYGALGEAILLESPKPHALIYFVRQDLDIDENDLEWGLSVDVNRGRSSSVKISSGMGRWKPDCVIKAKDGWDGELLERYYCEIKTGDASFQRSQVKTMETLARDERILKIRVIIKALPDQYSLRIHEVHPPE